MPPLTPATVTTEVQGSYVRIDWEKPDENFAVITAYTIAIFDANGD